jgi:hypothetical protein
MFHFTGNKLNKPCPMINIEIKDELWVKLLAPQTWIYVVKDTIKTQISCPNKKSRTISLKRTGLIEIPSKCILITNNTILHPTMKMESQIISSFVFSIGDLLQPIACQKTKNPIPKTNGQNGQI